MTTPTELQTLPMKIARHRWPDAGFYMNATGYTWRGMNHTEMFQIDGQTAYPLWQEIAPKFVEKRMEHYRLEYGHSPISVMTCDKVNDRLRKDAKADAYEASLTPLGIAKAYCEVYGLEG
jgi:hypothetical protein